LKLRDHPLMSYGDTGNWPPLWTHARHGSSRTVKGEVGVLRYVHANSTIPNKCFLVIDYQAESYVGSQESEAVMLGLN
jgi:hypothetical protein